MRISERQRSWLELGPATPIHAVMQFTGDRLELGAGTVLARMADHGREGLTLGVKGQKTRVLALLAAAYRRPISPQILGNIRRAGKEWARGDACLAQIHLALTGLPKLDAPEEAAYRLFITDGLLESGIPPRDILRALDLDPEPLDRLDKQYNPAELRIPAGSGIVSGEWTMEEIAGGLLDAALAPGALVALGVFAAGVVASSPKARAVLGHIFLPAPAMPGPVEQEISGREDLRYHWNVDEGSLILSRKLGETWVPFKEAHIGLDGIYRDSAHRPIGREVDGNIVIDIAAATSQQGAAADSESDAQTAVLPFPLVQARVKDEPKLCPAPGPDVPSWKSHSARAKAYQSQISGLPPGLAVTLNGVTFDGSRPENGYMLEGKGPGLKQHMTENNTWKPYFTGDPGIMDQAQRQSEAAGNRIVEWHFAEKPLADRYRELFHKEKWNNIMVFYTPAVMK